MKFRIKSEPEKVAEFLKTNRPLSVGDVFYSSDDFAIQTFIQKHPHLVEVVQDKELKPQSNKMLKKENLSEFKSK